MVRVKQEQVPYSPWELEVLDILVINIESEWYLPPLKVGGLRTRAKSHILVLDERPLPGSNPH